MFFKLEIPKIEYFYLKVNYSLVFFVNNPHKITVLLYNPPDEEGNPKIFNEIKSVAFLSHQPSTPILEVFECIKERKVPPGISDEKCLFKEKNGTITYVIPAMNEFPQNFQSYTYNVFYNLLKCTRNVIESLRWRLNVKGKHDYYIYRNFEYTLDMINWFIVPIISQFDTNTGENLLIREEINLNLYQDLCGIVNSEIGEPIAHELFREAWEQIFRNPRSAIVLGVAAAETGFKDFIIKMEPETEWIVKNLPSPPLKKMLVEYLPILPVKCKINGNIILPPQKILKDIEKGIQIRNNVVHKGSKDIKYKTVKNVLLSIKDLLWLLDYYLGFEWAIEYIRPEIRDMLMEIKKEK